nr:MAG TPA: hypothetical protein [Caudoviricetes sp.]
MIAGTIDHSDRATNKSLNPFQSRTSENQEARTPAHKRGEPTPKLSPLRDSLKLQQARPHREPRSPRSREAAPPPRSRSTRPTPAPQRKKEGGALCTLFKPLNKQPSKTHTTTGHPKTAQGQPQYRPSQ